MIHDFVARWACLAPNRIAVHDIGQGVTFTYAALDEQAARLATALRDGLGLAPGARVAVACAGRAEVLVVYLAAARAGLVMLPLNTRLAGRRVAELVAYAEPEALVFDQSCVELVEAVRDVGPIRHLVALDGGVRAGDYAWETLLAAARPMARRGIDLDAVSLLLSTSGTTGRPKGVAIPWRQVVFNAVNTALTAQLTARDSALAMLPLFHTGGLHCLTTPLLHQGGQVILTPRFDAEQAVDLMEARRITTTIAVPTMFRALLEAGLTRRPLPAVRALLCGGAPCPYALIEAYHEAALPLRQGYGLTEVGPNCFTLAPLDGPHRLGSIGWPAFHSQVRLVDEVGEDVADDTPGELLIRGPHVMTGYFRDAEATAAALDDAGWFWTGDMLRRTEDGAHYVVGRKKEMFISGGENVYPAAVEAVLQRHPGLADAVVLPVADARWGQVGVAAVVPHTGEPAPDAEELRQWARQHLAGYEVPKAWRVVQAMPLNASGKVDRQALREALALGREEERR